MRHCTSPSTRATNGSLDSYATLRPGKMLPAASLTTGTNLTLSPGANVSDAKPSAFAGSLGKTATRSVTICPSLETLIVVSSTAVPKT